MNLSSSRKHFGFAIVPQQSAFVIERLGKYTSTLLPGFHFLIPFFDRIAYVHSLKEQTVSIPNQAAITQDNVTVHIDGILYLKITDPYAASYGITDGIYSVSQLAQTTMRSEIGKMCLDNTFAERDALNTRIVHAINQASTSWGVTCMRYEIRDIMPPPAIRTAMEKQAEAERKRRADILQSEGDKIADINVAEGRKQSSILRAEGESQAVRLKADAAAMALEVVSKSFKDQSMSSEAAGYRLAEQWIQSWEKIAKESNTIVVPAQAGDPAAMVAQSLALFGKIKK
jgi:regulator of protease activity HflC (stomatin/prohibitin superfamily)